MKIMIVPLEKNTDKNRQLNKSVSFVIPFLLKKFRIRKNKKEPDYLIDNLKFINLII